jgi:peptidoglycan-associated lipoprotein
MKPSLNRISMYAVVAAFAFVAGCHHQVASAPPAAKPPQPTATAPAPPPAVAKSTPSPAPTPAPSPSIDDLFNQNVKDAFFDYNKADIRTDAQSALLNDAEFLRSHPDVRFTIAGHCDDRGSEEYNLGLGDRRAAAAKRYLTNLGIDENRMQTVSYGKEKPFCMDHNEACWQQNRRGHFIMAK